LKLEIAVGKTLVRPENSFGKCCCDRKSPSGIRAKLRTVAASNNRVHTTWSLCYCLFAPRIYIIVIRPYPVRGESHIQRNATGEVATVQTLGSLYVGIAKIKSRFGITY